MWTNIWTLICSFMYLMFPGICNFVSFWWVSEEQYRASPSSVSGGRVCHERWPTPASLLLPVALTAAHGVSPSLSLQPLITASGFLKKIKKTQTNKNNYYIFFSQLSECPQMPWQLTVDGNCGPVSWGLHRWWPLHHRHPVVCVRELPRYGLNWYHSGKGKFRLCPEGLRSIL